MINSSKRHLEYSGSRKSEPRWRLHAPSPWDRIPGDETTRSNSVSEVDFRLSFHVVRLAICSLFRVWTSAFNFWFTDVDMQPWNTSIKVELKNGNGVPDCPFAMLNIEQRFQYNRKRWPTTDFCGGTGGDKEHKIRHDGKAVKRGGWEVQEACRKSMTAEATWRKSGRSALSLKLVASSAGSPALRRLRLLECKDTDGGERGTDYSAIPAVMRYKVKIGGKGVLKRITRRRSWERRWTRWSCARRTTEFALAQFWRKRKVKETLYFSTKRYIADFRRGMSRYWMEMWCHAVGNTAHPYSVQKL